MQIKHYKYNDVIKKVKILELVQQFKEELIENNNFKFMELNIYIVSKDLKLELFLTKEIKINIKTKVLELMSTLKKNIFIISKNYNDTIFNEIYFEYKEISFNQYISDRTPRSYKYKSLLKPLIKSTRS